MDTEERWHRHNVPAARKLRRSETRSETILWAHLHGRGFHGLKFRRQHPVGQFVIDFYCEDFRLAIEIDGGVYDLPAVAESDRNLQEVLENFGIRFVRITAESTELEIQSVLAELERVLGFV